MTRIPNVFHFVFGLRPQAEPFHLVFYLCIESCWRVNQPDEILVYYHHEPYGRYWELAKRRVTPVRIPLDSMVEGFRYRDPGVAAFRYAHRSDFVRLERLLARGGIYADMDTIFVRPFPARLREQRFVLGRENDVVPAGSDRAERSLCNAVIMAEPGAEFGQRWLDAMPGAFDGSWSNHSTLLPQRLSEEYPALIHVEPQLTFYKHDWTRAGIRALLQGLDNDMDGVVSMHLWSHLWWSRHRRDFSFFHAGRLTERHVTRVDTTYNVVARQYLPAPIGLADRIRWRVRDLRHRPPGDALPRSAQSSAPTHGAALPRSAEP